MARLATLAPRGPLARVVPVSGHRRRRRRLDRTRRLSRRAAHAAYRQASELPWAAASGIVAAGRRRAPGSRRSVWSVLSYRSVGSVLSSGSFLSVGSAGSVLSAGSILSFASAGSLLSVGSAGSILCIGSSGSVLSIGRNHLAGGADGAAAGGDQAAATVHRLSSALAVGALGAAVLLRRPVGPPSPRTAALYTA